MQAYLDEVRGDRGEEAEGWGLRRAGRATRGCGEVWGGASRRVDSEGPGAMECERGRVSSAGDEDGDADVRCRRGTKLVLLTTVDSFRRSIGSAVPGQEASMLTSTFGIRKTPKAMLLLNLCRRRCCCC